MLSAYSVVNLNDQGAGSLRQAILDANQNVGADVINFNVAGTIKLTSGALPAITDTVDLDGATAPGFTGKPVVEIDYNRFGGLSFNAGSDGSELRSLSLVNSSGNGVTLNSAGHMFIVGNYIGIDLNEQSAPNSGNGVALNASNDNIIGGTTIVDGYLVIDRNVISTNKADGISLVSAYRNAIVGNYIGSDVTGTVDLGNTLNGISVSAGADNFIGGSIAT